MRLSPGTGKYSGGQMTMKVQWWPNDYESNQQDAIIQVNLLFLVGYTCIGRCFRPSSGTLDCILTFWHLSFTFKF